MIKIIALLSGFIFGFIFNKLALPVSIGCSLAAVLIVCTKSVVKKFNSFRDG